MSGKRRIHHYYLLEEIGVGGMAKVYLASRPPDEKRYAVKILQSRMALDPEIRARFLREIKIISHLDHPRIVKIHDHGQCDGYYYFVMDYLPGGNLHALRQDRSASARRKIEVMLAVCEGLYYSHQNGVVHRDLKPENILLDARGEPVLVDFGIARAPSVAMTALTQSDLILGTVNYLSPEQRDGLKHVDHRSDLYALGVILYQLFTGQLPVGRFALPTEIRPSFSRGLESLIMRCLALDPLDRFPSADDVRSALMDVLAEPDFLDEIISPSESPRVLSFQTEKVERSAHNRRHLEAVLDILRRGTATERFDATRRLADIVEGSDVEALLPLLDGEEEKVQWSIIKVLGELRSRQAVEPLIAALSRPFCREAAAEALGRIGDPRALGPLVDLLNSNEAFGVFALVPIGRLGGDSAVAVIARFLHHEYTHIRECAVEALSQTDSEAAVSLLKECAQQDPSERVRKAARLRCRTLRSLTP